MNKEKLTNLIQSYIRAKESGELREEEINSGQPVDDKDYHELMESYRKWQLENILDYDKLTHYSDAEFAEKFGEMYDYSDGNASSHALNRGMHFKTDESRIAARPAFEDAVQYINNSPDDRFELLETIDDKNSPHKVYGLGPHMITTLVNAKYPDVPPVNTTTREFFANIGEPLPVKRSEAQRIVSQFFDDVVELSGGKLNYDEANHILWYSKNIESGRRFMEQNYGVTFEKKTRTHRRAAAHKKALTHEERVAEALAQLRTIHDQAMKEND